MPRSVSRPAPRRRRDTRAASVAKTTSIFGLSAKQEAGCSYFVTQVIYDVNAAKNLVSDYAYECRDRDLDPVPIVFTFSVCGSMQTLEFLRWLGVDCPSLDRNDLRHAEDALEASLEHAEADRA